MRRLTGLLTSLLLLHLILVGTDLTCARHGVRGGEQVAQLDASSHVSHHAAAPSESTSDDDSSCEVPTLPACCDALASCGVSIAADSPAATDDLLHLAAGILGAPDDAPGSWTLEPDPPPPKA